MYNIDMICACHYHSPIGDILLAEQDAQLIGLWFEHQKHYQSPYTREVFQFRFTPTLQQACDWLDRYFAGVEPDPYELNLQLTGTAFQQQVWQILRGIPYGKVTTYRDIAQQLAIERGSKQMSAQAVGGAVARNPISIIIPCHRVVAANGNLTGYASGLKNKKFLLQHENPRLILSAENNIQPIS